MPCAELSSPSGPLVHERDPPSAQDHHPVGGVLDERAKPALRAAQRLDPLHADRDVPEIADREDALGRGDAGDPDLDRHPGAVGPLDRVLEVERRRLAGAALDQRAQPGAIVGRHDVPGRGADQLDDRPADHAGGPLADVDQAGRHDVDARREDAELELLGRGLDGGEQPPGIRGPGTVGERPRHSGSVYSTSSQYKTSSRSIAATWSPRSVDHA
jgi:hypothetical protein